MSLADVLQTIPEAAKIIGGAVTGIFSFWAGYRQYRKRKVSTLQHLLKQFKDMYIKSQTELINQIENDSKRRKVLIEMRNFCPECYDQVTKKLNYDENHNG